MFVYFIFLSNIKYKKQNANLFFYPEVIRGAHLPAAVAAGTRLERMAWSRWRPLFLGLVPAAKAAGRCAHQWPANINR